MTNVGKSYRLGMALRDVPPTPVSPLASGDPTLQAAKTVCRNICASSLLVLVTATAWAGPPSDTLLPKTTKGYVSIANPEQFNKRWDKTQLGQLSNDEIMQAFVTDFRRQLNEEFGSVKRKLGLTWEDLKDVPAGEISLSIFERKGTEAAQVLTMDVTGHGKQAAAMLATVEKRFAERKGKKTTQKVGDTTFTVFEVPTGTPGKTQTTIYFTKDNLLVGVDDRAEAEAILKRFAGGATDDLKSVVAYEQTMARCQKEAGSLEPEARWFIDPFGFVFAERTLRQNDREKDTNTAKLLYDNGFSAIQGAGGYLNQLVDGHIEFLVRTSVYAPAVKGKENDPLRWDLSMRMLQLPNSPVAEPQSWTPRMLASYTTMNVKLADAFDNVGPVFDAIQEHEDAWKTTLEGWQTDPYGPQVDMKKDFIANLGSRISVMTAYDLPITEKSERSVFAIEATNEKELAKTLKKWMEHERGVTSREIGEFVVWERKANANAVEEPTIELPAGFKRVGSGGKAATGAEKKPRERVIPNSAVTVALGHLMMASDTNYLEEVLKGVGQQERLATSADYEQMADVMNKLAPGERSAWAFGRGDEEVRPMFDLIRQGRMPESKSMVGKLLNNMFTTEADRKAGTPRKQKIDGANLPDFEAVRRYFGPHGRVVRSEPDGWFITGAVLNKEAP